MHPRRLPLVALAVLLWAAPAAARDAPVATYLPAFAANGKGDVTVRNLLTHTGGLPAWLPLYSRYDTPQERYDNDAQYQGRGVYVDAVHVVGPDGTLFADSAPGASDRFRAEGWVPSAD